MTTPMAQAEGITKVLWQIMGIECRLVRWADYGRETLQKKYQVQNHRNQQRWSSPDGLPVSPRLLVDPEDVLVHFFF